MPSRVGMIEAKIEKRALARFDQSTRKWVLDDTVYIFEVRESEEFDAGAGVLKQVFVPEKIVWNE